MTDLWVVAVITVACCLAVGALGLLAIHALRHRSVTTLVVTATLVPLLAVTVAVFVNTRAMFISGHDSTVVLVALAAGLVVGVGLALLIGRWLVAGSQDLERRLRRLGDRDDTPPGAAREVGPGPVPAELAGLVVELEATRERLEESRRSERGLEASRRELVAFMSHDLRSPLTGLRALAEGIEDGVVDDVPAALAQVRMSVDRMSGLVDDLFELSRVSYGPSRQPRMPVSLREIAEDVVGETYEHARLRGVALCVEVDGDDRLPVHGVAEDLARALANLVANAVRHTPSGRSVRVVGGRGQDGRVRLDVLDGCGGIPDDELARVFDVGWRGAPARTPGDGGAGLGLAIARGVVQAHDGSIEVANAEAGCRFEVALPPAG